MPTFDAGNEGEWPRPGGLVHRSQLVRPVHHSRLARLDDVAVYGNQYQIVEAPGYVAIVYEMIHETRVIPLDGRGPVGKSITQDMGDARGRWKAIRIVVTTRNFKERSAYRNANPLPLYECHKGNYG
jgi:hypothetical protein